MEDAAEFTVVMSGSILATKVPRLSQAIEDFQLFAWACASMTALLMTNDAIFDSCCKRRHHCHCHATEQEVVAAPVAMTWSTCGLHAWKMWRASLHKSARSQRLNTTPSNVRSVWRFCFWISSKSCNASSLRPAPRKQAKILPSTTVFISNPLKAKKPKDLRHCACRFRSTAPKLDEINWRPWPSNWWSWNKPWIHSPRIDSNKAKWPTS